MECFRLPKGDPGGGRQRCGAPVRQLQRRDTGVGLQGTGQQAGGDVVVEALREVLVEAEVDQVRVVLPHGGQVDRGTTSICWVETCLPQDTQTYQTHTTTQTYTTHTTHTRRAHTCTKKKHNKTPYTGTHKNTHNTHTNKHNRHIHKLHVSTKHATHTCTQHTHAQNARTYNTYT